MTASALKFSLTLILLASLAMGNDTDPPGSSREAEATLVIYNKVDPDSKGLAEYYAKRRAIPADQVIGLVCPLEEEISREQFQLTIEKPLLRLFESKKWWTKRNDFEDRPEVTGSKIRFVALIRGMPLKIRSIIPPPAPDQTPAPRPNNNDPVRRQDEASVDSEIAALGAFQKDNFGTIPNPYFRRFSPILDSAVTAGLLLVCRLDAPDPATVRRMIDDSLHAEEQGLFGWALIDRRSTPDIGYREGDDWLKNAASECWNQGIPVILDNMPTILPYGFPATDTALYYGWYAWVLSGAMETPGADFQRGAVAVHIHSYSAETLRNPSAAWAAPLLTRGAAATLGNVYEPFLGLTAHIDVFNERLLQGFTFAESAYMSQPMLSWMNVTVGDPLYRPFTATRAAGWRRENPPENEPWITLQELLRKNSRSNPDQIIHLGSLARESRSGLYYEALGMLQSFFSEPREALSSLETAGSLYPAGPQAFRTIIGRIRILQSLGDKAAALKLIDRTAQRPQPADRALLLSEIRTEISPPPPTPPPSPKKP